MTKLHDALMRGSNREALRILDAGGAALDARDDMGRTALMLALAQSMNRVAEKLLEQGARTELTDTFNHTALEMTIDCGNDAGRNLLFRRLDAAGVQAQASNAAQRGDIDALAFLVDEMGASLTAKNAAGLSALNDAELATQLDAANYIEEKIAAPGEVAESLRSGARKPVTPMKTLVFKRA